MLANVLILIRMTSCAAVPLTTLGHNECHELPDLSCNPFHWCGCIDPPAETQKSNDGSFQEATGGSQESHCEPDAHSEEIVD